MRPKLLTTSRTAISGPSPDDAAFIVHATDSFQCVNVCCVCMHVDSCDAVVLSCLSCGVADCYCSVEVLAV